GGPPARAAGRLRRDRGGEDPRRDPRGRGARLLGGAPPPPPWRAGAPRGGAGAPRLPPRGGAPPSPPAAPHRPPRRGRPPPATAAGCQLVASCDLAVAGESARFQVPGGRGGWFCITPGVALARAVGRKHALEMLLTGDPIDARSALAFGLVNRVVSDGEVARA